MHVSMSYMNNLEKRIDPRKLVPSAKSIISVVCNYFTPDDQPADTCKISRYAYGCDYHEVIHEKLNRLFKRAHRMFGDASSRIPRW